MQGPSDQFHQPSPITISLSTVGPIDIMPFIVRQYNGICLAHLGTIFDLYEYNLRLTIE